jgi:hypothetical protein
MKRLFRTRGKFGEAAVLLPEPSCHYAFQMECLFFFEQVISRGAAPHRVAVLRPVCLGATLFLSHAPDRRDLDQN